MRAASAASLIAIAAALTAASPAFAVQTVETAPADMRLTGGVRLPAAYDPLEISVPALLAPVPVSASDDVAATTDSSSVLTSRSGLRQADGEPSTSALAWYERFTVAPVEPQILWGSGESFEVQAGDRWGVTLRYNEVEHSAQTFDLQDFSATAFIEVSDRVRLGGQLRFTSPEEEIFGTEAENKTPEVRFESAFKF